MDKKTKQLLTSLTTTLQACKVSLTLIRNYLTGSPCLLDVINTHMNQIDKCHQRAAKFLIEHKLAETRMLALFTFTDGELSSVVVNPQQDGWNLTNAQLITPDVIFHHQHGTKGNISHVMADSLTSAQNILRIYFDNNDL